MRLLDSARFDRRFVGITGVAVGLVGVLGCSSDVTPPLAREPSEYEAIGVLARTEGVGPRFASGSLDVDAQGIHAAAGSSPGALYATLPLEASGAVRLEVATHPNVWLEIKERGAASSKGRVLGGAVVYPSVFPSTDRVQTAGVGMDRRLPRLARRKRPEGVDLRPTQGDRHRRRPCA